MPGRSLMDALVNTDRVKSLIGVHVNIARIELLINAFPIMFALSR